MALSANRYSDKFVPGTGNIPISFPVAASTHIYKQAYVAWDASGNIVPCSSSLALKFAGLAETECDNSAGTAGAKSVRVYLRGVDTVAKSGTITDANRGTLLQLIDDATVALALAYCETNMAGASDNDLRLTLDAPYDGVLGQLFSFEILGSTGNNVSLSSELNGTQIVVTPATNGGGTITTTGALLLAHLNAHAVIGSILTATLKTGNATGAGAVEATGPLQFLLTGPSGPWLQDMDGSLAVIRWGEGGRR